jgi:hypothetical protein
MTKVPASPTKPKPTPKPKPKPKPKCKLCDKTLVPIADRRKRGTRRHWDWDTRQYHKKCWKQMRRNKYISRPPRWSSLVH